jgi:uncharacterized membrane protein
MNRKRLVGQTTFLLALVYPALIYFGLKHFSPKLVGIILGATLLIRCSSSGNPQAIKRACVCWVGPALLCVLSAIVNDPRWMLYLPVFFSATMLMSFGVTLLHPPSLVETMARLSVPDLTSEEAAYCRRMTQFWAVFFLVNGSIALWTVWGGSLKKWALYNGLVAYLLVGGIFAAEFLYRHWRFRRYIGLPTDPLLRRLFPPKG